MAIGLGKIFGFNFIENFNYAYMSKSIGEFWRRWHMSLGSWFREYIYIPLGGNRVSRGRWVFNTLVVWMLTGLWHGAAWNFVVWGLLYALFLMVEKFILKDKKMPQIFSRAYTLLIVVLGFVLFNAVDFTQAWSDITGMFFMNGVPIVNDVTMYYLASYSILLIVGVIGATPLIKNIAVKLSTKPKTKVVTAIVEPVVLFGLLAICVAYLVDGSFNPFLYFRF
jgi:alginate O-acetyltransferase complex protein AlgI